MLKVNEYGGRQAKVNEKRQSFKGWETLVINIIHTKIPNLIGTPVVHFRLITYKMGYIAS